MLTAIGLVIFMIAILVPGRRRAAADAEFAPAEPMDFAAWFEAYLDGRWHTFDARNNKPRIGRVVVGHGRDAIDVALITSFGPLTLTGFEVRAERAVAVGE